MITKEQFLKSLEVARQRSKFTESLYDLHIDILECEDGFDEMFTLFTKAAFTEEGEDWYYWYLYERPDFGPGIHANEADGTPIILDTDDDLWNYLIKCNYLK